MRMFYSSINFRYLIYHFSEISRDLNWAWLTTFQSCRRDIGSWVRRTSIGVALSRLKTRGLTSLQCVSIAYKQGWAASTVSRRLRLVDNVESRILLLIASTMTSVMDITSLNLPHTRFFYSCHFFYLCVHLILYQKRRKNLFLFSIYPNIKCKNCSVFHYIETWILFKWTEGISCN